MSLRAARWLVAWLVLISVLVPAPAHGEPRTDDEAGLLVQEARVALERGDYPRAGALLDRALTADPRQIHVYVLRASVYGVGRQYRRAVEVMRKARTLAPDNLDVLAALGMHLVFAREYAEGVPLLERVVARGPARYDAQAVLGLHYVRTRQWQRAIVALHAYLMARPEVLAREDDRHRAHLAEALLRTGEPRRARALYRQVLAAEPTNELARLGLLWATAAIDCRAASTVAARLQDLAARYPAVILVEAQCALARGAHARADSLAAAYRVRAPDDAQGWGLTGRVAQAAGRLKQARGAFARAAALAPGDPRWVFELARADRRAGDAAAAARRLRASTPPAALERAWTIELAWALLDLGQYEQTTRLLMPVVAAYRDDGVARAVLGTALLHRDQLDGAIEHLESALSLGGEPLALARASLARARETRGRSRLAARQLAAAESDLGRAVELGAVLARGAHAAVLIERGAFLEAHGVLAAIPQPSSRDLILLAKVHAGQGRPEEAERALDRALALEAGPDAHQQVRIELAALRLRAGRAEAAMEALAPALVAAPATALERRVADGFASAGLAAATDAMGAGNLRLAHRILTEVDARLPAAHAERRAVACHLAVAATGAGARETALSILRRLQDDGAGCPFAAPADKLAVPILEAWNDGLSRRRARVALRRLDALRKRATGPAQVLWQTAVRDVALRGAVEAYDSGDLATARRLVAAASSVAPRGAADVEQARAVMLLEAGTLDGAIAALATIADEVPEAHLNLGIAWERKGDPLRAAHHFEAALAAGIKHPQLRAWVESKRRVWGGR